MTLFKTIELLLTYDLDIIMGHDPPNQKRPKPIRQRPAHSDFTYSLIATRTMPEEARGPRLGDYSRELGGRVCWAGGDDTWVSALIHQSLQQGEYSSS